MSEIEDIMGRDDSEHNVPKEPRRWSRKAATHLLRLLRSAGPERLSDAERKKLWARIGETAGGSMRRTHMMKRVPIAWAAACIIAVLLAVWWFEPFSPNQRPPIAIAAQHNQTALLDTGTIHIKGAGDRMLLLGDKDIVDVSSLARDAVAKESGAFNTLTVPYGKRTEVVFPDGSKVWLNAGSQLTFPEVFDRGTREVYLEGEGYFEIAHDPERPFHVYTSDMLVTVLGTSFNISSYPDDSFTSTVLVSGEIALQGTGDGAFEKKILEPGNTATWQRKSGKLDVRQVNVEDHISWTQRQLVLKNTPLAELLVRLGRIYNTKIISEKQAFDEETFSGRLDLTQPLFSLLHVLYNEQEYTIDQGERRITIRRKSANQ